jgi:hypothetical protein
MEGGGMAPCILTTDGGNVINGLNGTEYASNEITAHYIQRK